MARLPEIICTNLLNLLLLLLQACICRYAKLKPCKKVIFTRNFSIKFTKKVRGPLIDNSAGIPSRNKDANQNKGYK